MGLIRFDVCFESFTITTGEADRISLNSYPAVTAPCLALVFWSPYLFKDIMIKKIEWASLFGGRSDLHIYIFNEEKEGVDCFKNKQNEIILLKIMLPTYDFF